MAPTPLENCPFDPSTGMTGAPISTQLVSEDVKKRPWNEAARVPAPREARTSAVEKACILAAVAS